MMSERSIYLSNSAVLGMLFFIMDDADTTDILNRLYLTALVLTCICAVMCTGLLSAANVLVCNTPTLLRQEFGHRIMPICRMCFTLYFIALSALVAAIGLTGYGNNYAAYGAEYCVGLAIASLVIICCAAKFVSRNWRRAKDKSCAVSYSAEEETSVRAKLLRDSMRINLCGQFSTRPSTVVFVTLCFHRNYVNDNSDLRQTHSFLVVNCLTCLLGMLSATFDSLVTYGTNDLPTLHQKLEFVTLSRPLLRACVSCYQFMLLGWLLSVGLAGIVIYEPGDNLALMPIAAAGVVLMYGGAYFLFRCKRAVRLTDSSSSNSSGSNSGSSSIREQLVHGHEQGPQQQKQKIMSIMNRPNTLHRISSCAYFLGW